jgi:hypothetical protein
MLILGDLGAGDFKGGNHPAMHLIVPIHSPLDCFLKVPVRLPTKEPIGFLNREIQECGLVVRPRKAELKL